MSELTGTCYVCRLPKIVKAGKIVEHDQQRTWRPPPERLRCNGSGRGSVEHREKQRAKAAQKRLRAIDTQRDEARVVLDAVLSGRSEFDDRLTLFQQMALTEYRIRYPKSKATTLYVKRTRKMRRPGDRDLFDVYCRMCGELLLQRMLRNFDEGGIAAMKVVDDHTIPCALMCLAGMREYNPIGTYRLPSDLVRDEVAGE